MNIPVIHIKAFLVILSLLLQSSLAAGSDVFVIVYATADGETGHVGIAVENYDIHVRESFSSGKRIIQYDTVKTGALTYYDLWPKQDTYQDLLVTEYHEAQFYKLPAASWEPEITVASLIRKGIPHKENRPPDAMVRLKTGPASDYQLSAFLTGLTESDKKFNALFYNCADFVKEALEFNTGTIIQAEEDILLFKITTPNRLFEATKELEGARVLLDPGDKVKGNFASERLLHPNRKNEIYYLLNTINP